MTKTTIIAICGKSAAGKDTLKRNLQAALIKEQVPVHLMISDTTRPRRIDEANKVDYNFISQREFLNNIDEQKYIEYSCFRGWYYGVPENQIRKDKINIGIFNADGIKSLYELSFYYNVIIVYIKVKFFERMRRSYYREQGFKFEFLRRAFTDF